MHLPKILVHALPITSGHPILFLFANNLLCLVYMASKSPVTKPKIKSKTKSIKPATKSRKSSKTAKTAKTAKTGELDILILCGPLDAAGSFLSQLKKVHINTPTKGNVIIYKDVCPEKLSKSDVVAACAEAGLTKERFDIIVTTACRHTNEMFWPNVAALLKKGGIAIGPVMGNQWNEAAKASPLDKEVIDELHAKWHEMEVYTDKSDQRLLKAEKVIKQFSADKKKSILDVRRRVTAQVVKDVPALKPLEVDLVNVAVYQKS